jgi:hypothetical protein
MLFAITILIYLPDAFCVVYGIRECLFVVRNISFTIYNKSASENLRSVQFVFLSRQKGQCVVSSLTVINVDVRVVPIKKSV